MTNAIVIQARMGSSRLPGKVLLPLAGAPLLARMVERVREVTTPVEIIVATTTLAADEPIVRLCAALGVRCYRGHPTDLLSRHVEAARIVNASVVAKIPSDCPAIDPTVIDLVFERFLTASGSLDYVSNLHPPSWPDGMDVEVMSADALARADREATRPHEREHTTPYLWDQPELFRVANVLRDGPDLSRKLRLTIDYAEDHALLSRVFDELHIPGGPAFPIDAVVALADDCPELFRLNACHAGVSWYRHHAHELRTIRPDDVRNASSSAP